MDTPIACTLSTRDYQRRTADLAALAARALRSREQTERGERLTFARSETIEHELEAAVAAEATCCGFLRLEIQRHEDRLVLDIAGPAEARPVIAELFA